MVTCPRCWRARLAEIAVFACVMLDLDLGPEIRIFGLMALLTTLFYYYFFIILNFLKVK